MTKEELDRIRGRIIIDKHYLSTEVRNAKVDSVETTIADFPVIKSGKTSKDKQSGKVIGTWVLTEEEAKHADIRLTIEGKDTISSCVSR